jgi:hypothetical protein
MSKPTQTKTISTGHLQPPVKIALPPAKSMLPMAKSAQSSVKIVLPQPKTMLPPTKIAQPSATPVKPSAKPQQTTKQPAKPPVKPAQPPKPPAKPTQPPKQPAKPTQPPKQPAKPTQPPKQPAKPTQLPKQPAKPPVKPAQPPAKPPVKPAQLPKQPVKPVEKSQAEITFDTVIRIHEKMSDGNIIDNDKHRCLILVTERDRQKQQEVFLRTITSYLAQKNVGYSIYVVHQNNSNSFNKALLYNIGYKIAIHNIEFDYIIMHDIDLILNGEFNYGYTDGLSNLYGTITNFFYGEGHVTSPPNHPFVGGISIISRNNFSKINGYSNQFEGWGYEDTNFAYRAISSGLKIFSRGGVFDSWPNSRENPDLNINRQLYKNPQVNDGLSTLKMVRKLSVQPQTNFVEFKLCDYTVDPIHAQTYHLYVDFHTTRTTQISLKSCIKTAIKQKICEKKKVVICFAKQGNYFRQFILDMFRTAYGNELSINVLTEYNFNTDILVCTYDICDPKNLYDVKYDCYKIFCSGEVIDPYNVANATGFDLIIDTRVIPKLPQIDNIYVPFYVISMYERRSHSLDDLIRPIEIDGVIAKKVNYCAYLYNRCTPLRESIYDGFNRFKHVDALGVCRNHMGNDGKCVRFETDRAVYTEKVTYNDLAVAKYVPYKFVLAIENTNCDGYITEKFVNPLLAGAIPIYCGTSAIKTQFNPKRFIFMDDFGSLDDCIQYVLFIDNNEQLYRQYLSEPLFVGDQLSRFLGKDNNHMCEQLKNILTS